MFASSSKTFSEVTQKKLTAIEKSLIESINVGGVEAVPAKLAEEIAVRLVEENIIPDTADLDVWAKHVPRADRKKFKEILKTKFKHGWMESLVQILQKTNKYIKKSPKTVSSTLTNTLANLEWIPTRKTLMEWSKRVFPSEKQKQKDMEKLILSEMKILQQSSKKEDKMQKKLKKKFEEYAENIATDVENDELDPEDAVEHLVGLASDLSYLPYYSTIKSYLGRIFPRKTAKWQEIKTEEIIKEIRDKLDAIRNQRVTHMDTLFTEADKYLYAVEGKTMTAENAQNSIVELALNLDIDEQTIQAFEESFSERAPEETQLIQNAIEKLRQKMREKEQRDGDFWDKTMEGGEEDEEQGEGEEGREYGGKRGKGVGGEEAYNSKPRVTTVKVEQVPKNQIPEKKNGYYNSDRTKVFDTTIGEIQQQESERNTDYDDEETETDDETYYHKHKQRSQTITTTENTKKNKKKSKKKTKKIAKQATLPSSSTIKKESVKKTHDAKKPVPALHSPKQKKQTSPKKTKKKGSSRSDPVKKEPAQNTIQETATITAERIKKYAEQKLERYKKYPNNPKYKKKINKYEKLTKLSPDITTKIDSLGIKLETNNSRISETDIEFVKEILRWMNVKGKVKQYIKEQDAFISALVKTVNRKNTTPADVKKIIRLMQFKRLICRLGQKGGKFSKSLDLACSKRFPLTEKQEESAIKSCKFNLSKKSQTALSKMDKNSQKKLKSICGLE